MFAIVEASGRQYQLEAGRFVDVDRADAAEGDTFVFDKVLMLVNGSDSTVGKPFVDGATVVGKVLAHGKTKKIIVYHQRPKKGTRKKQGHRQHFTRVLIDQIKLNDKVLAQAEGKKASGAGAPEKTAGAKPKRSPKITKTVEMDKVAAKPAKETAKEPAKEAKTEKPTKAEKSEKTEKKSKS